MGTYIFGFGCFFVFVVGVQWLLDKDAQDRQEAEDERLEAMAQARVDARRKGRRANG